MVRIVYTLFLLFGLTLATRAAEDPAPTVSLDRLAADADLVALAQVRDTDYRRQRDIPVSGSAFLKVLIPYKGYHADDLIEVYEKGLHEHECYFPTPDLDEEGRRYLVFLRRDPDAPERYRGLTLGCALDVLVTRDNRYALRIPASRIPLSDPLDSLAEPMHFADRHAVVDDAELVPAERNALLASGHIEAAGPGRWRWLRGVELSRARQLIEPESLAH